jgi:hypothetical protein
VQNKIFNLVLFISAKSMSMRDEKKIKIEKTNRKLFASEELSQVQKWVVVQLARVGLVEAVLPVVLV